MKEITELKEKISKLESGLKSKNTPENQKKIFEKALETAKLKLKELEQNPPKNETRGRKKGVKNKPKEEPVAKDKKPISQDRFKKLMEKLKGKKAYSFLRKMKKKNIKLDAELTALPAGKRISASGNVYYEYRPNRTDVSARHRLASGGGVDEKRKDYYYAARLKSSEWDEQKQEKLPNSTWSEAVLIAKQIAKMNKTEVRLSESEGFNNQGHYFHWQSI
jgi:hypothetical protein